MADELRLLRLFVRQDIAQRYAGNLIGLAWVALGPLLQLALFTLVFVHIFKARVPGLEGAGYVAFLALGMWPWYAFAEAVTRACPVLSDEAGLLDKIAVPPAVLVMARVATPFLLHAAGFVLVLITLGIAGMDLHWRFLPLALLVWLLLFLFAFVLGLFAALTQVFVRDLTQILGYVMTAWLFLSPILYLRSMAPASMTVWFDINPVAGLIENVRDPLLFGRWQGADLAVACAGVLLASLVAAVVYRRLRPFVEDFL